MKTILRLFVIAAVSMLLLCGTASAAPKPDDGGFTISDYDVHVTISEKNVYNVTETIAVVFTEPRHGIYRDIPVNNEMKRPGLASTKVKSTVSGVKVEDYKYSVKNDGSIVRIIIGDPNKTVISKHTYVISYKLRFFDDGVDDFDEAYYNIIGTEWDTKIDHATFSVELPKPFDASKLGFSFGGYSARGYDPDELKFSVEGNVISGYTTVQMGTYTGLTMRLQLPQGYFDVPDPRTPDWIIMGVIAALCLVSLVLFLALGVDYKPVRTVEFYAPPGMTPADVGYIIDGCVDDRDVIALLMYWADKGYLKIEDLGSGNFRLTKLRELGVDAKGYETVMFQKLFGKSPTVETDDLENKFYKTVRTVQGMVAENYVADRSLFTKASMKAKPWLGFFTIFPMILTLMLEIYRGVQDMTAGIFLGITFGLGLLLPVFLLIHVMRKWKLYSGKTKAGMLIFSMVLWAGSVVWFLLSTADNIHTSLPWVAVIGTVVLSLCAVFIRKRTKLSAEWYAKIMSFREFITLAERDRIVALVEQNPSYFFNVLPYAWVMDVTDKWAEKFEGIAMEQPEWYPSQLNTAFSASAFASSMTHSMTTMSGSMTSSPSSSSSSSGGGSGFSSSSSSGGGGGGGGGGSW